MADEPTRKSLTLLVAHFVSSTQVEREMIVVEPPRRERGMMQQLMMMRTGWGRQHKRKLPSRSWGARVAVNGIQ